VDVETCKLVSFRSTIRWRCCRNALWGNCENTSEAITTKRRAWTLYV